ncbi:MAG TPA: DNA-protecting protein DprA, partial [Planctomycetota bacterium]|nr:DNA-protecting protein DprA [Planctomycetota bacterium]
VGAVPGPADSAISKGPHALLRQGAKLVEDAADILEEIPSVEPGAPGDLLQRVVWQAVGRGARTVDRARAMAGLRANVAARVVEELVRAGWLVRDESGGLAQTR